MFNASARSILGGMALLAYACLPGLAARGGAPAHRAAPPARATKARAVAQAFQPVRAARMRIVFERNEGQTDAAVRYLTRGSGCPGALQGGGGALFLTRREAVMALPGREGSATLRLRLLGANGQPQIEGLEPLSSRSNYLTGRDPRRWRTGVPHFARVRTLGVYPGIDLEFHGIQGQLEYDFIVRPGADPRRIRVAIAGARRSLTRSGDLALKTPAGILRQRKPRVYQPIAGERREVAARYLLRKGNIIGFGIGKYDRRAPLVIDPVIDYATFLGGASTDIGNAIATDGMGNAYVAGQTLSLDFPRTNGSINRGNVDAFVSKINTGAAGQASLVYSTYLGGTSLDIASGIDVDAGGSAYVSGQTTSPDFPLTAGAFQAARQGTRDAFVTRINPVGTALEYSTYLGGTDFDVGGGIDVHAAGMATVTGQTSSANFPVTAGAFQAAYGGVSDAFISRIDTTAAGAASLAYSSFLGGSGTESGTDVAVESSGLVLVTGQTFSTNFLSTATAFQPGFHGSGDVFVTRIDPAVAGPAALAYSSFLGGSSNESGRGIAVNGAGDVFVTGQTLSLNFPVTPGAFQTVYRGSGDAFAARFDPAAAGNASLVYSTYLGGTGADIGNGVDANATANAFLTGSTRSTNFPVANAAQPGFGGLQDAFVTKLDPAGTSLSYSTYLGGSGDEQGFGIAADPLNNAFFTGSTLSPAGTPPIGFPVTGSAFQMTNRGGGDAFVARYSEGETVQFSAAAYQADENAGNATISVTRSGGGAGTVAVQFATSNGTASAGSDYTAVATTLTFAPGETIKNVLVPILDDANPEGNETVNLTLSNPTGGASLGAPNSAVLTILDNDGPGSLRFSASSYTVREDAGSAMITVNRVGGSVGAASVRFQTSNGTASAGSDYTITSVTLNFASGETVKTVQVPVLNDTVTEPNETVNLRLSNATGASLGTPDTAVLTILDDDQPGQLQFSAAAYAVNENQGAATITVNRVGGRAGTVSVRFATSNGTASAGSDYESTSGTLTFLTGESAKSFDVPILDDARSEPNETVNLALSNPTGGATLGTPRNAVLTIFDDDRPGSLQFTASTYAVAEGAGRALITVVRVGGSAGTVSVRFATSNGTALAGTDYVATSGTLTFVAAETTKSFEVEVLDDNQAEADETVNLALSNPTGGASLGIPHSAVLTIRDNDTPGALQFSAANYTVNENAGTATITVNRSGGSAGTVSVRFATSDGTATAGTDYTRTTGTLVFINAEVSKTFSVPILEDSRREANETVNLKLANPTGGATLGTPRTAVLTIVDNDQPGQLRFSAATYRANEGDGAALITVTRTGGSSGTVSVQFSTSNGTASAGSDYTRTNGTLRFLAGETSKTFTVPILQDARREGDETVLLTLSNPSGGATLGTPRRATLTIADDDP